MSKEHARIAVFISGGGSNLQALIDATHLGVLSAEIALVVSSRRDAYGLKRAADQGIPTLVFKKKQHASPDEAGRFLLAELKEHRIDYIALAGFLLLLPSDLNRSR